MTVLARVSRSFCGRLVAGAAWAAAGLAVMAVLVAAAASFATFVLAGFFAAGAGFFLAPFPAIVILMAFSDLGGFLLGTSGIVRGCFIRAARAVTAPMPGASLPFAVLRR